MTTRAVAQPPNHADAWLQPREDSVASAEAMADRHLQRTEEVQRVGKMVRLLDDLIRVPGTRFGIGLDAIVGFFVPVVGDAITGLMGLTVIAAAARRGVPGIVIARMILNLVVDLAVGALPVVGDAFDLVWRSNIRNLALLERHQGELEPAARRSDYAIVALATTLALGAIAAPFVLLYFLAAAIF